MKILFSTYTLAFQNPGGGERVLLSLQRELQALGHTVDLYDPWIHHPKNYDLVHGFSCLENEFWKLAKESAPGVPLVITPTLFPKTGLRAWVERLKHSWGDPILSGLSGELTQWKKFRFPDLWLPTTEKEAELLVKNWSISLDRVEVLPNGVDSVFMNADPEIFRKLSGLTGFFVLHVGRFHPVKNHLRLIHACQNARVPLVLIGSPDRDQKSYFEACKKAAAEASSPVHLFTEMSYTDPALASAYAACGVFALPSEFETFGIVALEAASSGTPLILTETMRSRDLFAGVARFIDPHDEEALTQAIREAAASGRKENPRLIQLAQEYQWPGIARKLESLYHKLKS